MPEKRHVCWGEVDELDARYHDEEWGVPCHDDRDLFERLMLEGFQAGLSWSTILRKREGFFAAFDGWEAAKIAAYDPDEIARLMADARIVRNRLKCEGAVKNAAALLHLQIEHGSFDDYIWSFAGGSTSQRPPPLAFGESPR